MSKYDFAVPMSRRSLVRWVTLGLAGSGVLASASAVAAPVSADAVGDTDVSWTNVVGDFQADPSGKSDSTSAFQGAINAGLPVYVPPGTYACSSGPLVPKPGMHVFGNGYITTKITCSGAPLFNMDPPTVTSPVNLESIEIDHLTLGSDPNSPADIFWGANIVRSSVHHCNLVQHGASSAIWNASANTGQGTTYMAECDFYYNREDVYGLSRTIAAWHLSANPTHFRFNDNEWRRNVCFNNDKDASQYWYHIIGDNTSGQQGSNNNRFHKITFEYPCGGMIHLQSTTGDVIDDVTSEDISSLPVGNPLIYLNNAPGNAAGCSGIAIRDYSRRGGNPSSGPNITDICVNPQCSQILIDKPTVYGGGNPLQIDFNNGAQHITIIAPVPGWKSTSTSGAQYVVLGA